MFIQRKSLTDTFCFFSATVRIGISMYVYRRVCCNILCIQFLSVLVVSKYTYTVYRMEGGSEFETLLASGHNKFLANK